MLYYKLSYHERISGDRYTLHQLINLNVAVMFGYCIRNISIGELIIMMRWIKTESHYNKNLNKKKIDTYILYENIIHSYMHDLSK